MCQKTGEPLAYMYVSVEAEGTRSAPQTMYLHQCLTCRRVGVTLARVDHPGKPWEFPLLEHPLVSSASLRHHPVQATAQRLRPSACRAPCLGRDMFLVTFFFERSRSLHCREFQSLPPPC